jgi:prepilin-type N-terminal cleavage/methylation domain-containing protein
VSRRGLRQQGFTLAEMSVVLLLLGLLGWGVSAAYGNVGALRERDLASRSAEALQQALRAFALHNARLPCPDLTGQGWEGNAAGQCPAGAEAGWLPYRRWAWTCRRRRCRPATRSTATLRPRRRCRPGGAHRAHRRQPGQPRSGRARPDRRPQPRPGGRAVAGHTRLTGDAAGRAPSTAAPMRANPAYWLVLPLQDRDQNGDRDSVHALNFSCAYSPGTAASTVRDDVVLADTWLPWPAGWRPAPHENHCKRTTHADYPPPEPAGWPRWLAAERHGPGHRPAAGLSMSRPPRSETTLQGPDKSTLERLQQQMVTESQKLLATQDDLNKGLRKRPRRPSSSPRRPGSIRSRAA